MELEAMQAAGLSPMDVLVAATRNGAQVLNLAEHTGTVTPGSVADLVVLDADPLAGIANVRRISLVIRQGRIHQRTELEWHSLGR
jgi:imidazolonepropionase-like amidohydrolase